MPRVLPSSFTVGEILKLWPKDLKENWCTVVAPDGREYKFKSTSNGSIELWLAQAGNWHYFWSEDDHGMLQVVPETVVESEVVEIIDGS